MSVERYWKNIGGVFQGEERFIEVVPSSDYAELEARCRQYGKRLLEEIAPTVFPTHLGWEENIRRNGTDEAKELLAWLEAKP